MRISVYSDLHLEFEAFEPPPLSADAVVLAGDIHLGTRGVVWAAQAFAGIPVVYVPGNHEFYGEVCPGLLDDLRRAARGTSVQVLSDERAVIAGITFFGCTLWTDFALQGDVQSAMGVAQRMMQDYHHIRLGGQKGLFTPADSLALHRQSVAWLEAQAPLPRPLVVVSHHAVSPRSLGPFVSALPIFAALTSDLAPLIGALGADLWIHGHLHLPVDYRIGSTRILANPRGYPNERGNGFRPDLIVEVPTPTER